MRSIITILFIILLYVSACKEEESQSDGVILSQDFRRCMCCGGWFIDIENDTLRFLTLPDSSIDLNNEKLPLPVILDWHHDENACLGDEIIVEKIRKK